MKKKIMLTALSLLSLTLVACNNNDQTDTSVEPVYKGMTVSKITSSTSTKMANKDISDIVNATAPVDSTIRYYVNPGETFRLHVSLSNPTKYEIQSLTLNGKKYASYMFADGSDLENIYLEMTAPQQSGYQDYTLESMKYLNDTQVKDIGINENNSISVGVRYTNSPFADINNVNITATSYSADISVTDQNRLVKDGTLYFYVTDGSEIVCQKELNNGLNHISLDTLSCSFTYQLGVVGLVDLADGRGQHSEWLTKESFVTDDIYSFENIISNQNSVSFDVTKNYGLDSTLTKIDLEKNGTVVDTISSTDPYRFVNLQSNSSYSIAIHYDFGDSKDNVVKKAFRTGSYQMPSFVIQSVKTDYDSLELSVDFTDDDDLLKSFEFNLYDETGSACNFEMDEDYYLFNNLRSDTKYTAYLSYSYDAHDGKGETKKSVTEEFSTLSYVLPEPKEVSSKVSCNSIYVCYSVSNEKLAAIDSIDLYKDGSLVQSVRNKEATFTSLVAGQDYVAKINYTYDLNDGHGSKTAKIEKTYHTSPDFSISEITSLDAGKEFVVGDKISLKARMNNSSNVTIKKLYVNGKETSFTLIGSYIMFEYTIKRGEFSAGHNEIYISSIVGQEMNGDKVLHEYSYDFAKNDSNQFAFEFYSTPYVSDMIASNDLDYYHLNDSCFYEIKIGDLTDQTIDSVTMKDGSSMDVKTVGGKTGFYLPTDTSGMKTYQISGVNYTDASGNASAMDYDALIQYYVLPDESSISITTVEEFMAMESGKTYSLDADLDFNGIDYVPFDFDGVLRGNDHALKNLRLIVPDTITKNSGYGLFSSAKGFIDGLTLDNFYLEDNVTNVNDIYTGLIAGTSDELCLRNIQVNSTCLMKLNGSSSTYSGVLVGLANNKIIVEDCSLNCTIWAIGNKSNISGSVAKFKSDVMAGFATIHRNEICNTFNSSASSVRDNSIIFVFSSNMNADISDILVNTDYCSSNCYHPSYLTYADSKSNVKINHVIDMSSRYLLDGMSTASITVRNSCLLTSVCCPSLDKGSASSVTIKENFYLNDSYYNGETSDVLALEDISTYYDVMKFDSNIWTIDDVPYASKVPNYSNILVTFKKPTINLKK